MCDCGHTRTPISETLYTSDIILYDGTTLPASIPAPVSPSLNEAIYGIAAEVDILSTTIPTTTLETDDITLSDAIAGTVISLVEGSTLQSNLEDISTGLDALYTAVTLRINQNIFNANTILKADTDNTPVALTVASDTILGRLAAVGDTITALTLAQVITALDLVERDGVNLAIQPINTGDRFAVGDETAADQVLIVKLEDATFANNPYLIWKHDTIAAGYDGLVVQGMDSTANVIDSHASKEDSYFLAWSEGTGSDTKDQGIKLIDQTAGAATIRYWCIRKDGADSKTLKWIWWDGAIETTLMNLTIAGLWQLGTSTAVDEVLDEDNMASDSATALATQQSIKAYADTKCSQTEADAIEAGAGLGVDGSYTPPGASHYLTAATDLFDADEVLDEELYGVDIRDTHDMDLTHIVKHPLLAVVVWDFAVDGGAVGDIDLNGATNMLPDNAIITKVYSDTITTVTDGGTSTGTIKLKLPVDGDLTNTITVGGAGAAAGSLVNGIPDWDAANYVKTSAARGFQVEVGVVPITAGKIKYFIHYVQSE